MHTVDLNQQLTHLERQLFSHPINISNDQTLILDYDIFGRSIRSNAVSYSQYHPLPCVSVSALLSFPALKSLFFVERHQDVVYVCVCGWVGGGLHVCARARARVCVCVCMCVCVPHSYPSHKSRVWCCQICYLHFGVSAMS